MANAGAIEYVFKIDDQGTATIKKVEGQFKQSVGNMGAQASAASRQVKTGWEGMAAGVSGGMGSITAGLAGIAASFVSIYAAFGLAKSAFAFIKEGMGIAGQEEIQYTKLKSVLNQYGYAYQEVGQKLYEYAHQLQYTTGIEDSATLSAMSILAAFGATPEVMKRATTAAANLAIVMNMDLESAVRLVAKAMVGKTTALERMGVAIDKAKLKTEGFAAIEEALSVFQGQAAAQSMTYEGQLKRLGLQYDEVKESIGYAIIGSDNFRAALETLVDEVFSASAAIDGNKSALQDLTDQGVNLIISALGVLAQAWAIQAVYIDSIKIQLLGLKAAYYETASGAGWLAKEAGRALGWEALESWGTAAEKVGDTGAEGARSAIQGVTSDIQNQSKIATEGSETMRILGESYDKNLAKVKESQTLKPPATPSVPRGAGEAAAGGGAAKKEKEKKLEWTMPEPGTDAFESDYTKNMSDYRDKTSKTQEDSFKHLLQEWKNKPQDFWSEFGNLQQQYTSGKSTWDEQQQAFERLQQMYQRAEQEQSTFGQQANAMWQSFAGGMQNALQKSNSYLQTMSDFGKQTFDALGSAFQNSFVALMHGDIGALGSIWKNFLRTMLDNFIAMIAQMITRWLMMKLITGIFGGFMGGGAMATGGIFSGSFMPMRAFAYGGVATSPTLGLVAETGRPEAVVPLPDGRSIPVSMKGGGSDRPIEIHIVNTMDPTDVVSRAAIRSPHVFVNPVVADYGNRGQVHRIISRGGK